MTWAVLWAVAAGLATAGVASGAAWVGQMQPEPAMTEPAMTEPDKAEPGSSAPVTTPGQPAAKGDGAGAPEAPALAGPRVPESARSLVKRDAKGVLQRLSTRPEIEALAAANLDPETNERAREVVREYKARLSVLVIENVDRAIEAADALKAKDKDRTAELAREFYLEFNPSQSRDVLMGDLREVLSAEQGAAVQRLVDEYWDALIAWETRSRKPKDGPLSPQKRKEVEGKLVFQLFKDELKAAYETTLQPYREKMERLESEVQPTPEQRERIVGIVTDYIRATKARPTPSQRREVMGKIYRALDDERRAKLFELVVSDVAAGMW